MKRNKSDDTYSEEETQRRVEATLRAALTTPPKPKTAKLKPAKRGQPRKPAKIVKPGQ
jgi:hypothetical protein